MFKAIARNSCVLLLGLLPSSILDGLGQMLISLSLRGRSYCRIAAAKANKMKDLYRVCIRDTHFIDQKVLLAQE